MNSYIQKVENAIKAIKNGEIIIVTDHEDRENEGDFIIAAEKIKSEDMNFIIRNSSGIVCLSMKEKQLKKLNLPFMVPPHENTSFSSTPFTVSIDASKGITTGVSAADRVKTILDAIADDATQDDLCKPGHIYPLVAKDDGVLKRAGHTEGALDLAILAGLKPAAVLCEVMNLDGTMSRGKELEDIAKANNLQMISIQEIIDYRRYHEDLVDDMATTNIPLQGYGEFKLTVVKEKINEVEHVIIEKPRVNSNDQHLVRIHSSCLTGDILGSLKCDCNNQLHYSLDKISKEGGILIYLNQEGRGVGLLNKIKAYALQENGLDTVEANEKLGLPVDPRNYYLAANILKNRGIDDIRLLTNNPNKIADLNKYGICKVTKEQFPNFCNEHNKSYLETKKTKMNHSVIVDIA